MTLLDSQLFQRIDSAELLTWVQEQVSFLSLTVIVTHGHPTQAEEKSLNLTKFTEHFNNMSYWTRTIILQQPDAKVATMIMRIIMIPILLTMIMTIMSIMISGARAVCDEVHKDYEVASEDEQLQFLPGHPLRPRLRTNQASR